MNEQYGSKRTLQIAPNELLNAPNVIITWHKPQSICLTIKRLRVQLLDRHHLGQVIHTYMPDVLIYLVSVSVSVYCDWEGTCRSGRK